MSEASLPGYGISASADRLKANDLFGLFPSHVRKALYDKAETKLFKAGDVVFKKDEDGPWLAAVLAGRVRMARHAPDGREMLITMVERGEILGERAVYDGLPRSATAVAEEETALQIFRRDDLLPAFYAYPDTLMYIIRTLCNRMHRYLATMELYALHSLPTRLAHTLLFLAQKYGEDSPKGILLRARLSQSDLAHQMATSRESVNRQLKAFACQGLIELDGADTVILDAEGLQKLIPQGGALGFL